GDKSMMESRVWPKPIPASASTKTPRASGPRWASFAAMPPAIASSSCVPGRRSSSRKPAMPHMRSHPYLHAIIGDFPAGRLDRRPLARVFAQRRIGVVDVNVDLAANVERRELFEAAILSRHVHMADALPRLVEQALSDHLVVGVERAVEEKERRACKPGAERIVEFCAARNEIEVVPARCVRHLQANRIAFLGPETGACGCVLKIESDLAWHGKGLDSDPDGTGGPFDRKWAVKPHSDALHEFRIEHVEDVVRGQHVEHAGSPIDGEGLPLAEREQASDRVDI